MDNRLLFCFVACVQVLQPCESALDVVNALAHTDISTVSAGSRMHTRVDNQRTVLASRRRRADDDLPFLAVVSQHSQELVDIKAQLAALAAELNTVKARATNLEQVISFTVRFSKGNITALALNRPVIFDQVAYNVGSGYNSATGIFTAPASGTYVFALSLQRHGEDEDNLMMAIMKGINEILGLAEVGFSPYEHGTMVVSAHLKQGDEVSVQPYHGTMVWGAYSTAFSGFRISPQ